MRIIKLTQGKTTVVDDIDLPKIAWYKWCFDGQYAAARIDGKKIRMHRFLMGEPDGIIDHINRDKLDNRRGNLRIVSYSGNNRNSGLRSDNTSGYKGISWDSYGRRWRAYAHYGGRRINLGSFKLLGDAVKARSTYL